MSLHLILFEPEIPQNTGNIGRLSLALGAALHLIEPLGFSLDDKYVRRAGLDYWPHVNLQVWKTWSDFTAAHPGLPLRFFTTKATLGLWDADLPEECGLVFGPESRGLPAELREQNPAHAIRLPMRPPPTPIRSLNLSVSVGIAAYEHARRHRGGIV